MILKFSIHHASRVSVEYLLELIESSI
jgi:hypothetical protein